MKQKMEKHGRGLAGTKCGFTLIELLVVIAIISLLVSILLPSLTKAKELARRVVCASNLRNIGIAFQMYQGDWDGQYPACLVYESYPGGNSPYSYYRWGHQLIPYMVDINWSDPDVANYGIDPKFYCPEDPDGSNFMYAMNAYKAGSTTYYGWISKAYEAQGYSAYSYHYKSNDLLNLGRWTRDPNYWVLLFESDHANTTYNRWHTTHGEGSNVLKGEGAVDFWPIVISEDMETNFISNINSAYSYWASELGDYLDQFRGPGMFLNSN